MRVPGTSHVCPKCSYEHPCYFAEGDIVSLKEDLVNEPAPWTGMVLEVERDKSGRVYRVLWGPPPSRTSPAATTAARHSGEHRGDELQRFLVPLVMPQLELRSGGGGKAPVPHRSAPPVP